MLAKRLTSGRKVRIADLLFEKLLTEGARTGVRVNPAKSWHKGWIPYKGGRSRERGVL